MIRVLVTGASGFIGSHVLDALLKREHEVYAVARRAGAPRASVTWVEADLLEPGIHSQIAGEARATHLMHLAWTATPGRFWTDPENERWIDATLRLLRAFGEAGGRRVVMAGTCAEYRWDDQILREHDTPLEPATLYGACKHATHVAATAVATQLAVSLAWARLFFLYGPGEHPDRLVPSVTRALLAGQDIATTEGTQRRDFMHVDDAAEAFCALLASEVTGAINIASGRPVAVREVILLAARAAGDPARVRFGARADQAAEPALVAGDARRLTGEVGFHPAIGLEAGIERTVAWWRTRAGAA